MYEVKGRAYEQRDQSEKANLGVGSGSEGKGFIEVGQEVEQVGLDEEEIEMTIRTFCKDGQNGLIQEI